MTILRLRQLLSRWCSSRTMGRIVDPVLADIAAEPARARWAGYLDLTRALALHAFCKTPRQWLGDDAAVLRRLAALSLLVGMVTAVLMNAMSYASLLARPGLPGFTLLLWLMPSFLALTIPAALLIAVPVALKDRFPDRRLIIRALALALVYAAALFVAVGWVVPAANQSFRTAVLGKPLSKGLSELSFVEARQEMVKASFRDTEPHVRNLEFSYHSRLALVLTPVSMMLLALALSRRTKTKYHPWRTGLLALLGYTAFIEFTRAVALGSFIRGDASPIVLAWAPHLALACCGTLALYFSAIATPAKPWTTLPPPGSSNDLIS